MPSIPKAKENQIRFISDNSCSEFPGIWNFSNWNFIPLLTTNFLSKPL
jgi:hypothetical protein